MNVLIVDDQEVIRDTLQTALDDEGFTVECAANGQEALDILDRWKKALGAVAVIAKPFDIDNVISAIEGVC